MTDPLSELLAVAGVRGSLISRAELAAPYGVATAAQSRAVFHTPHHGRAWVSAGGEGVWVGPGDVAVLPRGSAHEVCDAPGSPCRSIGLFDVRRDDGRLPTVVEGDDPDLRLLCGSFELGAPARRWLLDPLPDVFVVRGAGAATGFVRATLGLLEAELAGGGLGSAVVSNRLVEVLVVYLLRGWAETQPGATQGWLAGMGDPQLGQVLAAIHANPAGDWTLDRMARRAGLSRTLFATRFRDRVGIAPGAWMTEWRIAVARRALREGADVSRAAETAGYASEASFSRAFKRVVGQSPGAWRSRAS